MSYSRSTGLVYIPTIEMMGAWSPGGTDPATWKYEPGKINNGMNGFNNWTGDIPVDAASSALLAWDPVKQQKVWEQKTPGAWNGGVLSTAGGLVFQGHGDGRLVAYAADTGERLWDFDAHMGIVGSPITYSVNGRQYVTLVAGWGGTGAGYMGSLAAQMGWVSRVHNNRVVTFALDEKGQLPSGLPPRQVVQPVDDPKFDVDPATAKTGSYLYSRTCIACHGAGVVASGYGPDLRASAIPLSAEAFAHVVRDGALMPAGMPAYSEFGAAELEQLRQFIRQRAREDLESNKRTGLIK
jgi:quinohemoprotein ethanol dehydrogenase